MAVEFSAVVLAGGRARRFGGVDKLALPVGGRSLLERTFDALGQAGEVVVVGPRREIAAEVVWTREDPPGGGPLAGLRAGLSQLSCSAGLVVVLAADHPHLTEATVMRLLDRVVVSGAAGAVLVDRNGRDQWLVGAWRSEELWRSMPVEVQNLPVRGLLAGLSPERVAALGEEAADVDTPEDLRGA